jgi:hypothetical protein
MPRCTKCGQKGLFLKLEKNTGLCNACGKRFREKSRALTEKITAAKNEVALTKNPAEISALCQTIESYGNALIALQLDYVLQPSQELVDLLDAYKKIKELAEEELTSNPGQ